MKLIFVQPCWHEEEFKMSYPIVVIGAGLSGLYSSYLLAEAGHRVLLVEGRERIGGRIVSENAGSGEHRVDLGPSWFWPGINPRVEALLAKIGLRSFAQHHVGAISIERADGQMMRQAVTWAQQPESFRVAGGMQAVVDALAARLGDRVHVKTGTRLRKMTQHSHAIELQFEDQAGVWTQLAVQVILAIPPRLLAQDIGMAPSWPQELQQQLRNTPTWMAQHAKLVAVYQTAFWREQGWSGAAMSQRGPLSEIHDASDESGQVAALFGFFAPTANYRAGVGEAQLERLALAQLSRLFGPAAAKPLQVYLQDWSSQPFTASQDDRHPLAMHPIYRPVPVPKSWEQRLWLAGTEQSAEFGGYLEGALDSAEVAVAGLLQRISGLNVSRQPKNEVA
jgi:monoamine oxidase